MAGAIGGGLPAVVAWKQLEKTGEQQRARWEKQPSVQREVAYAKDFASNVKNVEELINNRRFMNFALSAFGLGLTLFVVTLMLNVVALRIVQKYREQYD